MRILIISDSHDNIVRLKHVIGFAKKHKFDVIIHCGDWSSADAVNTMENSGINYPALSAQGIPSGKFVSRLHPRSKAARYSQREIKVYGVLGNADVDPQIISSLRKANIIFDSDFLKLELGGKKIGVCHYPDKLKEAIESKEYDVLFCGHIHDKHKEIHGKTLVVRPGALGRTLLPSFAVYDAEKNDVEFVDLVV